MNSKNEEVRKTFEETLEKSDIKFTTAFNIISKQMKGLEDKFQSIETSNETYQGKLNIIEKNFSDEFKKFRDINDSKQYDFEQKTNQRLANVETNLNKLSKDVTDMSKEMIELKNASQYHSDSLVNLDRNFRSNFNDLKEELKKHISKNV